MKRSVVIFFGVLFFSYSVFGMGGDKPGPHGGYIKMPGTYHVELVDEGRTMRIYLLDLSMKNPTTNDSSVALKFVSDKSIEINCKAENKSFVCPKPKENFLSFKQVIVESLRNKIKAKAAIYTIPLVFDL